MCIWLRIAWSISLLSAIALLDQVAKFSVQSYINGDTVVVINGVLNFTRVWNTGISFGFLSHFAYSNLLFLFLSCITIIMLNLYSHMKNREALLPITIISGGALGNIIDRVNFGSVYDFIDFYLFGLHFPIFNTADFIIFLGMIFYLKRGSF